MKTFALIQLLVLTPVTAAKSRGRTLVRATQIAPDGSVAPSEEARLDDDAAREAHFSLMESSLSRKGKSHGHHNHNVNCEGRWTTPSCTNCAGTLYKVYSVSQDKVGNGNSCPASNGQREEVRCSCDCEGYWQEGTCTGCSAAKDTYVITRSQANGGQNCPASQGQTRDRTCECGDCKGSWEMQGGSKNCEDCGARYTYKISSKKSGHGQECPFRDGDEKADCEGHWPHQKEGFKCKKSNNCGKETVTFKVTSQEYGPGSTSNGGFGKCTNRGQTTVVDCDESNDSCDQDCQGGWVEEECLGKCGQIATDRFRITQPLRGNGKKCLEEDGVTKSRECPCSPEDCRGDWDYSEKNKMCTPDKCASVIAGAVPPDSLKFTKEFKVIKKEEGAGMKCEAEDKEKKTETCPCGAMQTLAGPINAKAGPLGVVLAAVAALAARL